MSSINMGLLAARIKRNPSKQCVNRLRSQTFLGSTRRPAARCLDQAGSGCHHQRGFARLAFCARVHQIFPVRVSRKVTDQNSYDFEDLLKCGHGDLFGPGNARLPLPPMLMFDRIVKITDGGGSHGRGEIVAELDVHPDIWFYRCHFESDPVMPGCLGLDALWQLLGFFLGWIKRPGPGRALSVGEVKFFGRGEARRQAVALPPQCEKGDQACVHPGHCRRLCRA